MNIYKLVWKYGKEDYVIGDNIAKAFSTAGIGNGALRALDYWEVVSELPDELKSFEIVTETNQASTIYNPNIIDRLKETGFNNGEVTEISYGSMKFKYQFFGKSSTAYQYIQIKN